MTFSMYRMRIFNYLWSCFENAYTSIADYEHILVNFAYIADLV